MYALETAGPQLTKSRRFSPKKILSRYSIYIVFVILVIVCSLMSNSFLTLENVTNLLRQQAYLLIIAMGMLLVIITGGIDLSVVTLMGLSVMLTAGMVQERVPLGLVFLTIFGLGILSGFTQGLLISKLGLPAFIVTLAFMSIFHGASFIYSHGHPVYIDPGQTGRIFSFLGEGFIGPIPFSVLIAIVITIIIGVILKFTVYGRSLLAVGGNSEAAWFSGINPSKYLLAVYTICSLLAALAGFLLCPRLGMGHPDIGVDDNLDAIAAVVLGGASLAGGRGNASGTVVGVFTLGLIRNILNLMNIPSYPQLAIKGIIIIIAVLAQLGKGQGKN